MGRSIAGPLFLPVRAALTIARIHQMPVTTASEGEEQCDLRVEQLGAGASQTRDAIQIASARTAR